MSTTTTSANENKAGSRMKRLMSCFGLSVVIAIAVDSGPSMAQPFAYVTNSQSLTVSVIDTATNAVVATVRVGFGPGGVAVASDGSRVYVAHGGGANEVSVIDTVVLPCFER